MRLEITQPDVDKAEALRASDHYDVCRDCVVSVAMKRQTGCAGVVTGTIMTITFSEDKGPIGSYRMSGALRDKVVRAFDEGLKVTTGTYVITPRYRYTRYA